MYVNIFFCGESYTLYGLHLHYSIRSRCLLPPVLRGSRGKTGRRQPDIDLTMAQTARVTLHDGVLHRLSELLRWAVTRLPESTPTGDVWENARECCRMTASCVEVSQRLHLTQCAAVIFEAEHWASGNRGDTARTISCTVSVVDGWDRLVKHKALHVQELYTAENALMCLLPAARAEVSSLPTAGAEVSWRDISLWLETSLLLMMAVRRGLEAAA